MKQIFLAVALMFASMTSFAADGSTEELSDNTNAHRQWHCTAYPEGHGHTGGYSYSDEHYRHARSGAISACERATRHHCHDVHCHFDRH